MKPVKAKPVFYSHCYDFLKRIAFTYGYNLVLHGSMDRDLDLIAIPWEKETGKVEKMITEFAKILGSEVRPIDGSKKPHGRIVFIIDLNRSSFEYGLHDYQWYIDISVMPTIKDNK